MKFSVLMTTYNGEEPENLDIALKSILINQTHVPDQVVLVCDYLSQRPWPSHEPSPYAPLCTLRFLQPVLQYILPISYPHAGFFTVYEGERGNMNLFFLIRLIVQRLLTPVLLRHIAKYYFLYLLSDSIIFPDFFFRKVLRTGKFIYFFFVKGLFLCK